MKYGRNIIARTKQKCRILVYIALVVFLAATYIKTKFFTDIHDREVEHNFVKNAYGSRKLLERPVFFDDTNLWNGIREIRQKVTKAKTKTTPSAPVNQSTTTVSPTNPSNKTSKHDEHCEPPSISEFPSNFLTKRQRRNGGFLIHVLVSIYMCVGLAIVCDYFFVPSLEVICYKLDIQSDVAGATLMAVGSSAPELFASIIGVFITNGDIGIGTILGSAIFNVLFVLGMSGLVAKTDLQLAWWPLLRDGICYSISLVTLALVIVDGRVTWVESFLMLILYTFYVILMWKNQEIEKRFYLYVGLIETYEQRFGKIDNSKDDEENEEEHLLSKKERINFEKCMKIGKEDEEDHVTLNEEESELSSEESIDAVFPEDPPFKLTEIPLKCVDRIYWILNVPLHAAFFFTIPDIRYKSMRKFFAFTFIMSIIWIGALTYVLVWMMTVIGFTFNIPDAVMGLTFIAFGSSVPDALASILVARQGKGDMAVSQAMGSNVFDVFVGLGLPWLLKTLVFDYRSSIKVESFGILMSCFSIFLSVILLLVGFYYCKFKLTKKFGAVLLVLYVLFIIVSVFMEVHLWSSYRLPTCKY